jgi:PAS domain-containing protein
MSEDNKTVSGGNIRELEDRIALLELQNRQLKEQIVQSQNVGNFQRDPSDFRKENNEKFRYLSDLTNEIIELQDIDRIYKVIVDNLEKLYPDSIILYVSIDEKEMETKLETIAGIDNAILKKILSISGFNPIGKKYKLVPSHQDYFRSGEFVEFPGGLSDFVANEFPLMAAYAIERFLGLNKIYTIGIKKEDKLLGAIHFFTFNHKVIDDSSFIEILVKHAGIILEKKITEMALIESETTFKALFEKAPIGIAYHRMVYDSSGKPVDYYFIEANQSYQVLTGVNPVGKLATEAFPGIEMGSFDWIGTFGKVAKTGQEIRFQQYLQTNNRWYDCVGYQYKPDHFVAAFFEITDKKQIEDAFKDISTGLSVLNEATAGFSDRQTVTVFYADVVRKLRALTGGMTATLSIYNPDDKNLYVNYADFEPGVVSGLIQALGGKRVTEVGFPVSDEWYQQLSVKPIGYYKTLTEATFGVVPNIAGAILQKIQGIDRFLGIAYFLDNELYGTSLVAFRSNVPDPRTN